MSFDEFINKVIGRFVDYDHALGAQCVDLIRAYCQDVKNVNGYVAIPSRGNAKDIYKNFIDNQYFRKIPNAPTNMPVKGDIVFFKTSLWFPYSFGVAGHTGIVESSDVKNMIVFNQNYPTGSSCKFTKFSYKDCLGWLSPKV